MEMYEKSICNLNDRINHTDDVLFGWKNSTYLYLKGISMIHKLIAGLKLKPSCISCHRVKKKLTQWRGAITGVKSRQSIKRYLGVIIHMYFRYPQMIKRNRIVLTRVSFQRSAEFILWLCFPKEMMLICRFRSYNAHQQTAFYWNWLALWWFCYSVSWYWLEKSIVLVSYHMRN